MNYSFEIPLSHFVELRPGQVQMSLELFGTANGATGPHLPVELLRTGDAATWSVPVPPGVSVVGWQTEFNNKIAVFSANGGPELSYEPPLHPVGYNPSVDPRPTAPARSLQVATLSVKALQDVLLMTLRITWTIADSAMYKSWLTGGAPAPADPHTESHADFTLRLIHESGLIEPLKKFSGELVDDAFVAKAISTGTWDAMQRLTALARK